MKPAYSTILIIPCYNEEKRLYLDFYEGFLLSNPDIFLLFVNDGSRDNTAILLQGLQQKARNAEVISLEKNKGKGEAVRQGVLYCLQHFDFTFIGFADADLSTPLQEFFTFRDKMEEDRNIRMVLGSRIQMLGKNIERSLLRHWFGRIIATGIGKVINEPVYDCQCGAKLFLRETAKELFEEAFISRWLFDVEILSRYKRKYGSKAFRNSITEIAVSQWTEKQDSKLRYHYFFRMMYDLVRIRNKYFRH
ncbi:MAG: glycosyltransferase [Chitinophagaceae bacterium]|nr:glycosyltransferase [Chitinophagaceae bacterium]